jgi:hypothetical protein
MKKSIISAIVICLGLAFASCKKEYDCECKRTRSDGSGNSITTVEANYTYKDTRPRADSRCNDNETTGSDGLGNYTIDCEIK